MNFDFGLSSHLNWLLNHSLQAGGLGLLVLAVQWLFRRQLTNRWRFALWWIVVIRLILPFSPASTVSLFNLVPSHRAVRPAPQIIIEQTKTDLTPAVASSQPVVIKPALPVTVPQAIPEINNSQPFDVAALPIVKPHHSFNVSQVIVFAWLTGALLLAVVVIAQLLVFRRKLLRSCSPADAGLQAMFKDCRKEFGVSGRIDLVETDAVQSPALFGLWHPRLLLPRGIGKQFAPRELRYIFLHELAHIKRGDLWLNWLVTTLQVIHWFNPLLWLAFARLRADRELACDELALLRAGDKAGIAYGETVIKLLESLNRAATVPGLVGILEDKQQMRRRIAMIANFHRPGRWSALAVLLIAGIAAATLTDAQQNKPADHKTTQPPAAVVENRLPEISASKPAEAPDLLGQVLDESGAPLPVPSTVFVSTAAPKSGTSTFCPSCYPDCVKRSRTDARGSFKIESLDPQLKFNLLAVAKGYKPKYVNKVDPALRKTVNIALEPVEDGDAAPERSVKGQVVDSKGKPVEGAVVDANGIESTDGSGSWGLLPGVDPLAVTDANGEFLISSKKPFDMLSVEVSARAYASKHFNKLKSGASAHKLVLTEGSAITGRVLLNDKPLGKVSVGVSGAEREAGQYLGHFEVATDSDGRFAFLNLPPHAGFELYSLMGTMKKLGAVPPRKIQSGGDGKTVDAGDLAVMPAHRLAGKVTTSDEKPLPAETRLLVGREEAWDTTQVIIDQDGRFEVSGIPSGSVTLSLQVKGYHWSGRNGSVDELNPFSLKGRVEHDITNLVFLLEKGPQPQPNYNNLSPDYMDKQNRSIRGVEGGVNHSKEWKFTGRVLDSETKLPVASFTVTPGQMNQFQGASWRTMATVNGTNGSYELYVDQRATDPVLKIEAEGYLPQSKSLPQHETTNLDIILTKGSGLAGIVVTRDGKPAPDVNVVMLNGEFNQVALKADGSMQAPWDKTIQTTTDTQGHFAFKPALEIKYLVAASSDGYAMVSTESLATNHTITLASYAKITGSLRHGSEPATNQNLGLSLAGMTVRGINLQHHAATDGEGRFTFESVPTGHLQIWKRTPMEGNARSWRSDPVKEVDLKAGETLALDPIDVDKLANSMTMMRSSQMPQPKLVPGVQVKGVVLLPDGKPAAEAQVALQVEGKYLAIGKGRFSPNGPQNEGLIVNAGTDGGFSLPMYEGALSVVALNDEGIVQVSLEQLKTQPQITLQKWGRIEGTLHVGNHLGVDQRVSVNANMTWPMRGNNQANGKAADKPLRLPLYEQRAYQTRTDEQGHFVLTYVPPGEQAIFRMIPQGSGSWSNNKLATVAVKSGETIVTNIGGTGRTLVGHVNLSEMPSMDLNNCSITVTTPNTRYLEKVQQFKTDEERTAFYQSAEFQNAMKDFRNIIATMQADGSFRADEVPPGKYQLNLQQRMMNMNVHETTMFASIKEFEIPEPKSQSDDSSVDVGEVSLKKFTMAIPSTPPAKK